MVTSFNSYSQFDSVHPQDLTAHSREETHQNAANNELFLLPLKLLEIWRAMPGSVPHCNNVDPVAIGVDILPSLFILDVIEQDNDDPDFKWRLFGTLNSQRYGIEATGHLLSKAVDVDASIADSLRVARLVVETKEPRFMFTDFKRDKRVVYQTTTVILPLSDDNGNVTRLFGCNGWNEG